MVNSTGIAQNALTILILIWLGFLIYLKLRGGKTKDVIKEFLKGEV